ncbi:MAG TPA: hypothetical protein VLX56_04390 [Nitrososphaerales archaeon]|nr:hypothetical protein [Nitrososphaerales archaeon]
MGQLFFEKSVSSFAKLVDEIAWLDLDSGIRTFGDYAGRKRQLVFLTRSPHDTYTLMVYEARHVGGGAAPGRRLMVKEFREKKALTGFMKGLLSRPVRAFVY